REVRELRARLFGPLREVPAREVAPQRRQLTLICCQLTWPDGLGERLDSEDLREVVAAFHEGCEEFLGQYGGAVTPSMGGQVFACVGCKQVRESDAVRAVHAALRLAREVPALLQRRLPHMSLSGLATRVGLHTDLVVGLETGALQGEASQVASWLANQAGPGEVLVGEKTWRLVGCAFDMEPLGSRVFKGLARTERMELHRVVRERKAEVRFEQALVGREITPLVGREHELRQLQTLWERARDGQGAFVLVCGEAGIGKSRLLRELRERVPPEEAIRLRLQCWSPLSASALHPTVALLQELLRPSLADSPPWPPRELEEVLGALGLPEDSVSLLGLLLGLPIPEGSSVLRLTPERLREKTHETLAELLLRLARRRPVLVAIEDLHWADSSWLEFLGILLERIGGARLLIVLSTRPELRPDWSSRPWFHRLSLRRLPSKLAKTLVRATARGAPLPEKAVRDLVDKTDGMPLFIEEMTRMVLEQSVSGPLGAGGLPGSIPVTLHELLLARLDMRPSRQKALAQLGAVLGREFSSTLLAAVSGRGAAELRPELAGLVEAGLFQEERAGAGGEESWYRFRHALFQDAAYQSLPRSERRQHHGRIAQVLEERFPAVVKERPEVLAHHHTEAGQQAQAISYWRRAGMFALNRRELPEAVSYYTRALALLRGPSPSQPHPSEELQVLTALGFAQAMLQGFDSPVAAKIYARAWELLRRMRDVPPQLGASFWDLFIYHLERAEFSLCQEVASHVVNQAEGKQDQELLVSGHLMMGVVFTYWGQVRSALAFTERAMASASLSLEQHRELAVEHRRGSPTEALAYTSTIHSLAGRLEQARAYGQEALRLARRIGEPVTLAGALTYASLASLIRRDLQDALRLAEEFIAISRERGELLRHSWACVIRARVLAELGRPREALVLVRQLAEHWRSQRLHAGLSYCLCLLAEIHLILGQVRQGLAVVREARSLVRKTGERICEAELHRVRGELLRVRGLEPEAKSEFFRAIIIAREQGTLLFELRATVALGRLLRDLGRPEPARRLLARIHEQFGSDVDSTDLREARTLLEQLDSESPVPHDPGRRE
ncbi:MAG TPA: AAA family ATPase, partial [Archangium sp.]|nr:AAA family ATPase [Archangium sp.]